MTRQCGAAVSLASEASLGGTAPNRGGHLGVIAVLSGVLPLLSGGASYTPEELAASSGLLDTH